MRQSNFEAWKPLDEFLNFQIWAFWSASSKSILMIVWSKFGQILKNWLKLDFFSKSVHFFNLMDLGNVKFRHFWYRNLNLAVEFCLNWLLFRAIAWCCLGGDRASCLWGRTHVRIKGQNFYLETHTTPHNIHVTPHNIHFIRLRILPRILGTLY